MLRNIKDANLIKTLALPAAGATAYTASVDLAVTSPGEAVRAFDVQVTVDATTTLVNTKTCTITLQDSADNSSFADITGTGTMVVTGTSGNVSALTSFQVTLPVGVRRYIRASATIPGDGGTCTAFYFTLSLCF